MIIHEQQPLLPHPSSQPPPNKPPKPLPHPHPLSPLNKRSKIIIQMQEFDEPKEPPHPLLHPHPHPVPQPPPQVVAAKSLILIPPGKCLQ